MILKNTDLKAKPEAIWKRGGVLNALSQGVSAFRVCNRETVALRGRFAWQEPLVHRSSYFFGGCGVFPQGFCPEEPGQLVGLCCWGALLSINRSKTQIQKWGNRLKNRGFKKPSKLVALTSSFLPSSGAVGGPGLGAGHHSPASP